MYTSSGKVSNARTNPSKAEIEQYLKNTWLTLSHNNTPDQNNIPEQVTVTVDIADKMWWPNEQRPEGNSSLTQSMYNVQ